MGEVVLSSASVLGSGIMIYRPLLGQIVNVGFGPAGVLGLFLAGAGAALYFMRSMRPELARDHDIFFAAIGLLCGGILFFQGWRLDPILLFGQMLLTGTAVFFASESIRMRGIATDQARRNTPIVDDDRPVGRVYRAELDELYPSEEEPPIARIRSARDSSSSSRSAYDAGYDARSSYDDRGSGEMRSSRRSRSGRRSPSSRRASIDREARASRRRRPTRLDDGGDSPVDYSSNDRRRSVDSRSPRRGIDGESRSSRRRSRRTSTSTSDDYVDYRPIDYTGNNPDRGWDSSEDEWS